ncbi:hypothetical protein CCMSSC00406_0006631 [Pleurotus cornucopiae]|uniref:Uncharacterized protein n=1 Tax=Pleurotus cornucopiae TaxID=5321 RepID=A0ACB7IRW4_PLECO|nr:hypothetical protein CCMSSC00406_0006631 [Pleurotus cornucopiae]
MIFQLEVFFFLFSLLSINVLAAPVNQGDHISILFPRVLTPAFSFSGNLTSFEIPPAGTDKESIKKNKKAVAQQNNRAQQQAVAQQLVSNVLTNAQPVLGLPDNLAVTILNNFHTSRSDQEKHITFSFNAPSCSGTCVGHAYNPVSSVTPGKGQPGKIFGSAGAAIFGDKDKK